METPTVKTKSSNLTPWRSPRGVVSGKRALDSFRKQKNRGRSPAPSPSFQPQSPYPRELAALLSSRIDRYKRICPNIDNLEQKVGLSPITLNFPSPKAITGETKQYDELKENEPFHIQSSFLESIIGEENVNAGKHSFSENNQIIELIINLSTKFTKEASSLSDNKEMNKMIEISKQNELLIKKLQANLYQSQNSSSDNNHDTMGISSGEKLKHSIEMEKLEIENVNLRNKLGLYQKQIEVMSEMNQKEEIPSDTDEAVKVLKEKLQRSTRQVEEGKELASMLRTALASAIQDRISLEDSYEKTVIVEEEGEGEEDGEVSQSEEVKVDQGEYDEVLAAEYEELLNMHRNEALKEKEYFLKTQSLDETLKQPHIYTNDEHDIDYSKMNTLLEEKFLSQTSRIAARVRAQSHTEPNTEPSTDDRKAQSSSEKETAPSQARSDKPTFEEQHAAAQKTTTRSGLLSWIPGMSQQSEIHSAVMIF